ncbi:MAG: hypothetical protein MK211_04485 [Flavobacteriales bacterium]|jgi:hypothetical protein|uniref:hypothetical protein n=1 Tax=Candidatus Ulvibacter alkanivorans TaxID=2267620 RepID=UPI000DF3EED1|nr:hypothetical protein [Candidatus Ulvibacter alkanivorans]MCH2489386.1 hypothetical protein [Flavobacteriales bacterium]
MNTLYAKIDSDWNEHFIGYSALAIILSTCVGSMAVMTTLMQGNGIAQMFQLFLVVAACSAHNASILTVQKPSLVLKLLILSLVTSIVVMGTAAIYFMV